MKHGNHSKVNAITHAKHFREKKTAKLKYNPEIGSKYANNSRVSLPFWEDNKYIQNKARSVWHFRKEDRLKIKRMNGKEYRKKHKNKNSRVQ